MVDNSELRSDARGIFYRKSMSLVDKDRRALSQKTSPHQKEVHGKMGLLICPLLGSLFAAIKKATHPTNTWWSVLLVVPVIIPPNETY